MAQTFLFNIGITCGACVSTVESALPESDTTLGKISRSINLLDKTVRVTVENDTLSRSEISAKIKEMVEDVGIDCNEVSEEIDPTQPTLMMQAATGETHTPNDTIVAIASEVTTPSQRKHKRKIITNIVKGAIGILAGVGLIALMLSGVALPMVAMYAVVGVSSALTLALGAESYFDAAKKLVKSRTLTMDTLFTVSSLTMIAVSIASLFVPWLPMMCEAGILIFGFRYMGKAIEESIKQKISAKIKFADRGAKKVYKKNLLNDEYEEHDTNTIVVDEIVWIKSGDTIPLDGICENDDGPTAVINTMIKGTEEPEIIRQGEPIYAGMVVPANVDFIKIRVTKTKENSLLCRSDRESETIVPAPIEQVANKIMQYFIPAVFILAAISGIAIGFVFGISLAIQCIASVLVSACPCTFGLISPMAMQMGTAKAKEHGVHFKDAAALESADNIDCVVFDLNGTLTAGNPEVTGHTFFDRDESHDMLLAIAAEIESQATHKIAHAIAAYTKQKTSGKHSIALSDIDMKNHSGIQAKHQDNIYLLGNQQFLRDKGIEEFPDIQLAADDAAQIIYLVKNGKIAGYFKVEDPLRKDAKFVIAELKLMNKEVHICTGADEQTAKRYARKLGIDEKNVYANCVGFDMEDNLRSKTAFIKQLKADNKRVAMIGDAGNDALAIQESHFGIAVKSASSDQITQQNAGAVIDNSTLLPVVTAFAAAKETIYSIKQNLIISIAYNMTMILIAGGILIAIGFALNPAIGVALMVVQATFIILNQYRIYRQKFDHIKRYEEQEKLRLEQTESTPNTHRLLHDRGLTIDLDKTATIKDPAQQSQAQQPYCLSTGLTHSSTLNVQPQALASSCPEALHTLQPASSNSPPF